MISSRLLRCRRVQDHGDEVAWAYVVLRELIARGKAAMSDMVVVPVPPSLRHSRRETGEAAPHYAIAR